MRRAPAWLAPVRWLDPGYPLALGFAVEGLIVAGLALALLALGVGVARVGSYFVHPRALPVAHQDRAVALSQSRHWLNTCALEQIFVTFSHGSLASRLW